MLMNFSFVYTTRGCLSSCECEETQNYYTDLEDAEKWIKKDLSAVFRQMKKGNAYLRVSVGDDHFSLKQTLTISQTFSDIDNDVYSVMIFDAHGGHDDRKMSISQVKKTVIDVFRQIILVESNKKILESA